MPRPKRSSTATKATVSSTLRQQQTKITKNTTSKTTKSANGALSFRSSKSSYSSVAAGKLKKQENVVVETTLKEKSGGVVEVIDGVESEECVAVVDKKTTATTSVSVKKNGESITHVEEEEEEDTIFVSSVNKKKRGHDDGDNSRLAKRLKKGGDANDEEEPLPATTKLLDHDDDTTVPSQLSLSSSSSSNNLKLSSPSPRPALSSETTVENDTDNYLEEEQPLPKSLARLITIHRHIITLLILHYATHSAASPAILTEFTPQLSRSAGTTVLLVDLQRICTFSSSTLSLPKGQLEKRGGDGRRELLRVVEIKGRGKGIELVGGVKANIATVKIAFEKAVEEWWRVHSSSTTGSVYSNDDNILNDQDILSLIDLAPIYSPPSSSFLSTTTIPTPTKKKDNKLLTKGQKRLQELRNFKIIKSPSATAAAIVNKKENIPSVNTGIPNRKTSLMDRLRAKSLLAASAPPPPSREALDRKSSLQALECIIPVLIQLSASSASSSNTSAPTQTKTSFPLHTVISHIKVSLGSSGTGRNGGRPISNEECERSLRLLAEDEKFGGREFVKIVQVGKGLGFSDGGGGSGGLVGVVLDRKGREKVEKWRYEEGDEE